MAGMDPASVFPGILARFLGVLLLIGGTYNPSGYSYYHWVFLGSGQVVAKLCVGGVIFIGGIICVAATWRSLGLLLLVPGLVLIASLIWLLSSWRWIDLADPLQRALVAEAALAAVFTGGIVFSAIRFRLAGIMDSRTVR